MPESVYQACSDVLGLRQWVEQQQKVATGTGCFWLPIVLTAKGPLYGEAIGLVDRFADADKLKFSANSLSEDLALPKGVKTQYRQPVHLPDTIRQPLYQLGYRLLQFLSAPPATYLLQFGFQEEDIVFDRLWPFPAAPAIASIGVQEPDLFACHWYCLTGKPILDLTISSSR